MSQAMSYVHGIGTNRLIGRTIGDAFDATVAQHGSRLALISRHQDIRWTYAELKERVDTLAAGFLALGLEPGDRVGIWSPNCAEWVLTQFATAKAGLILVNINPAYRVAELEYALDKVGCKALVTAPRVQDQRLCRHAAGTGARARDGGAGRPRPRRLPALRLVDQHRHGGACRACCRSPRSRLAARPQQPRAAAGDRRAAAVRRRHQHPVHPRHHRRAQGRDALPPQHPQQRLLRRRAASACNQATALCIPVPLYHCFGMVMGNLACITHGATMVYPGEGFDPLAVLETVEAETLHGAATACRPCSSPSWRIRSSRASTSPRCAPASWPARPARSRSCSR